MLMPMGNSLPATLFNNLLNATAGTISGVQTAVTAIQTASPGKPIVLAVTPNITDTALFEELTAILPETDRTILDNLIDGLIDNISQSFQAMAGPNLAVINPNEVFARFTQQGDLIEGLYINPEAGGPVITDLFVGDLFHPGTIAQGLLANAFVEAFNTLQPDKAVTPLSDAEIVAFARSIQPVTTASLSASAPSALPGQTLTFTVQVATFPPFFSAFDEGTFPVPTGTVSFIDAAAGNRLLGIATLDLQGQARLQISSLPEGAHTIIASYSGNTVYPTTSTTSASVIVGTPQQVALVSLIQTYQERLGKQVTPPLLSKWTRWLDRGLSPETIARTIYHRVGHQPLPRPLVPIRPVPASPRRLPILRRPVAST